MNLGQLIVSLGIDDKGLNTAAKSMRQFGMEATKYLTIPITIVGGSSFNIFKNYERTLAEITGLTGTSREQTEAWNQSMLQLASTIGKKPQELAEAMYFIASAGIEDAYAMDVLNASAQASVAGLGEVKQVADLITSAMNAYGPANLSAAYATDVLTAAVREGKLEADALSHTMGYAIPLGAELGVSFEEVAAAMAAMSTTGIEASTAATNLRQMFSDFLKPAKQSEAAMEKMGFSAKMLREQLDENGLLSTLEFLKKRTAEYGMSLADIFPEVRSLTGALSLVGERLNSNKQLFDLVKNSVSDTDKAFNEVVDTLDQRYKIAIADTNVSLIKLGKSFKEYAVAGLEIFSKALRGLIAWFEDLSKGSQLFVLGLTTLLAILGPATIALSVLTRVFINLKAAIINIQFALWSLKYYIVTEPWLALAAAIGIATIAIVQFAKAKKDAIRETIESTWKKDIDALMELNGLLNTNLKSAESLAKRYKSLKFMNPQDLQAYTQEVESQIKLQQQALNNFKGEAEKASTTISDLVKKISDLQKISNLQKAASQGKLGALTTEQKAQLEAYSNTLTQVSDGYTELVMKQSEASRSIALLYNILDSLNGKLKEVEETQKTVFINEEITKAIDNMRSKEQYAAKMTSLMGDEFDSVKFKTDLYNKTLEKLVENLSITDYRVQEVANKLKNLKLEFAKQAMSDLSKQTDIINSRFALFGNEVNVNQELLNAYTNTLNEFAKNQITTGKDVEILKNKLIELREAISKENFKVIDLEEALFGKSAESLQKRIELFKQSMSQKATTGTYTIEGFITDTNQLAAYQKELDLLNDGMNSFARRQKTIQAELANAALQYSLTGDKLAYVNDQLQIQNKLWIETAKAKGVDAEATKQVGLNIAELNKQLEYLQDLSTVANIVSASFTDMMNSIGQALVDGGTFFDIFAETVLKTAQQIINALLQEAIAALLLKGVLKEGLFGLILASAAISGMLAIFQKYKSSAGSAAKLANGGIVPPGYPNDTYPALLTSGEHVIPAQQLPSMDNLNANNLEITVKVEGVARGKDIYYVVKEVERVIKNSY